jgi:hypothetical protein
VARDYFSEIFLRKPIAILFPALPGLFAFTATVQVESPQSEFSEVQGSRQWLMEEAPDQVIPARADY